MLKTSVKPQEIERAWYLVDAKHQVLGRIASRIAKILQGKHRPYYSPQWDMGDHVIVVNAERVDLTGKKEDGKVYYRHSNYPGGIKQETAGELRERKPEELISRAVRGMLPKGRLGKEMIKKLHVYAGEEHSHEAQNPEELDLGS